MDGNDQLLAQHDSAPVAGTRPTTGWEPSEIIVDRHALVVPPGNSASQILVILYDPGSGQRLPVIDAQGNIVGEAYSLATCG